MSKVMLIDGNSLTYRAFFALPTDITLVSGQVTNAVYGFTSMLSGRCSVTRLTSIDVKPYTALVTCPETRVMSVGRAKKAR